VSGDVTVRSASGDVMLKAAGGAVTIYTASGDVRVQRADGDFQVNTASGDVSLGSCAGSVVGHTASGDIELAGVGDGRVELVTVSGDVQVAVVPGVSVYLDLASATGDIGSDLEESGDPGTVAVEIKCRTVTGDIHITRARGQAVRPASPPPAAS
jgi:DUF4097 and DUF4098 domain-containing protein YvlB